MRFVHVVDYPGALSGYVLDLRLLWWSAFVAGALIGAALMACVAVVI